MGESSPDGPSVVVPAVKAPSSTCLLRSLGRRGVHTIAASEYETPPAFWSRYCDETVSVPSPSDRPSEYSSALLSLARRDDVEAITPAREQDAYLLAKHRDSFDGHVATLWPSSEQVEAVHDRCRLVSAAERAGVPVPETELLDEVTDWDRRLIVKARYALLTDGYLDSMTGDSIESPPKTMYLDPGTEPDVSTFREAMGHVPIVQEYVGGREFTFRALYEDGEPVLTTQKRLHRGYKYPRGPSVYHESIRLPELESVGRSLLDELDWHGPASAGFIRDDETGEFTLLEVNPRFWANVSLDVHAGIDVPHYYWRLARNEPFEARPVGNPGVASHILRGEFAHMHSVLFEEYPYVDSPSVTGTARAIASSLYRQPRFDLFRLEDPGPFARDLLNTVQSTFSDRLALSPGEVGATRNLPDGDGEDDGDSRSAGFRVDERSAR